MRIIAREERARYIKCYAIVLWKCAKHIRSWKMLCWPSSRFRVNQFTCIYFCLIQHQVNAHHLWCPQQNNHYDIQWAYAILPLSMPLPSLFLSCQWSNLLDSFWKLSEDAHTHTRYKYCSSLFLWKAFARMHAAHFITILIDTKTKQ